MFTVKMLLQPFRSQVYCAMMNVLVKHFALQEFWRNSKKNFRKMRCVILSLFNQKGKKGLVY